MSLRHAILVLLDVEPGTGYDLMTRFRRSVGFFWEAGHQQVYKELHALHADGYLDLQEVPQQGKPARKLYSINVQGVQALEAWLAEAAAPMKIRDPLLVKLFAGHRLAPELLAEEIERHRETHTRTLATFRGLEAMIDALPAPARARYRFPRQTLRLGIFYEQAWLAWCAETRTMLASD